MKPKPKPTQSKRRKLSRIAKAAYELNTFLKKNVGTTSDWPVEIHSDEDVANELCRLLNNLNKAAKSTDYERVSI